MRAILLDCIAVASNFVDIDRIVLISIKELVDAELTVTVTATEPIFTDDAIECKAPVRVKESLR